MKFGPPEKKSGHPWHITRSTCIKKRKLTEGEIANNILSFLVYSVYIFGDFANHRSLLLYLHQAKLLPDLKKAIYDQNKKRQFKKLIIIVYFCRQDDFI